MQIQDIHVLFPGRKYHNKMNHNTWIKVISVKDSLVEIERMNGSRVTVSRESIYNNYFELNKQ